MKPQSAFPAGCNCSVFPLKIKFAFTQKRSRRSGNWLCTSFNGVLRQLSSHRMEVMTTTFPGVFRQEWNERYLLERWVLSVQQMDINKKFHYKAGRGEAFSLIEPSASSTHCRWDTLLFFVPLVFLLCKRLFNRTRTKQAGAALKAPPAPQTQTRSDCLLLDTEILDFNSAVLVWWPQSWHLMWDKILTYHYFHYILRSFHFL